MLNTTISYINNLNFVGEVSNPTLVYDSLNVVNSLIDYTCARYPVDIRIERHVVWENSNEFKRVSSIEFSIKACFCGFYSTAYLMIENIEVGKYFIVISNVWNEMNPRITSCDYIPGENETIIMIIEWSHEWLEGNYDGVTINDIYLNSHVKCKNAHGDEFSYNKKECIRYIEKYYGGLNSCVILDVKDVFQDIVNNSFNIKEYMNEFIDCMVLVATPNRPTYAGLQLNERWLLGGQSYSVIVNLNASNVQNFYCNYSVFQHVSQYPNGPVPSGLKWCIGSVVYDYDTKDVRFFTKSGEMPYIMFYQQVNSSKYSRGIENGRYSGRSFSSGGSGSNVHFNVLRFISDESQRRNKQEVVIPSSSICFPDIDMLDNPYVIGEHKYFDKIILCNKNILGDYIIGG